VAVPVCLLVVDAARDVGPLGGSRSIRHGHRRRGRRGRHLVGSRETPRQARTADAGGAAAGPGVPAAGERSITAGGDISGIASTGDGASNIQR